MDRVVDLGRSSAVTDDRVRPIAGTERDAERTAPRGRVALGGADRHAGLGGGLGDRHALVGVRGQQTAWCPPGVHGGELPRQVVDVGDADVHPEPADRRCHVGGVTGEEHPTGRHRRRPVRSRLPQAVPAIRDGDRVGTRGRLHQRDAVVGGEHVVGLGGRISRQHQQPPPVVVDDGEPGAGSRTGDAVQHAHAIGDAVARTGRRRRCSPSCRPGRALAEPLAAAPSNTVGGDEELGAERVLAVGRSLVDRGEHAVVILRERHQLVPEAEVRANLDCDESQLGLDHVHQEPHTAVGA